MTYTVQASDDLETFPLEVSEATGPDASAIQAGLPPVNSGWEYRSFILLTGHGQRGFLRVVVSSSL